MDPQDPTVAELMEQERRIFLAHMNGFERQQTGLVQLAELYNAEIDALGQKEQAIDEQIARAQKQVDAIQGLVNAGSATVSRLSDAERILADLRSDKLDNLIATMTARENLNRSQRDLAKLQDEQQSEASIQLQAEQASLERLTLSQVTTMRMMRQSVEFEESAKLAETRADQSELCPCATGGRGIARAGRNRYQPADAGRSCPSYNSDGAARQRRHGNAGGPIGKTA
ncbi:hypothetical protein PSQ19_01540 [Devosia algicola]|uniref:AprE-like long alpha-helical hairpin domain-containing protein n=1 Tax=Devosia algicola TaxID=3026418 RepID=A0ABY7YNQ8_9HYPH|nr:hypothetical protein [Devosia algicola]WDR02936.1 hypothetical protein PSQ19_01540 [Devosia algicola]